MRHRVAGLLPAVVLVLFLAGCGSDDPDSEKSGSTGASASSTASESPSEPAAPAATGADYRDLLAALFAKQGVVQDVDTVEELNAKADFPAGIAVAELDKAGQTLCIEDSTKDIALTFGSRALVLHAGTCADGEDVTTLKPRGKDDLTITGDRALGEPVRAYFKEKFGS